jgi:hypothetical protein
MLLDFLFVDQLPNDARCENTIISKILSIQAEEKLSDMQKAQLRQELFSGLNPVNDMTKAVIPVSLHDASDPKPKNVKEDALKETAFRKKRTANLLNKELSVLGLLKTKLCCVFCLQLPKLPVSVRHLELRPVLLHIGI